MMGRLSFFALAFGLLFGASELSAQEDSVALSDEYFKMGMEVYDFTHRRQAKELFQLSASYNPQNAMAHLMAGRTIMLTVHKEEALDHFKEAWILDPKIDEDILYLIGQAYHHSEQFDSAIVFYEQFNRVLERSMRFQRSLKINEVNRKIFECRNGKIYRFYPVDVTIENLSVEINSEWPEYAPTITADGSLMVFTSRRPDNVNPTVADDLDYYEDLFISEFNNGQWGYAKNMGEPLNTIYHNASINLAPDGSEIFIYKDTDGGDIYESFHQSDGSWTNPEALKGEVNTEYLENSATTNIKKDRLFFTSNRPGGYGGTDIYMAVKNKNGAWINPINLGPQINTPYDEDGAFISASGEHLYFSSLGHAGMGDMDIYRSTFNSETGEWGEAFNLGYPINSVENDIYFVLTGDEKYAFYSSVKTTSKGEQDIYRIDMSNWEPVDLTQPAFIEAWLDNEEESPIEDVQAKNTDPSIVDLRISVVDKVSLEQIDATVNLISSDDRVFESVLDVEGRHGFEFSNQDYSKFEVRIASEGYLPYLSDIFVIGTDNKRQEILETVALTRAEKNLSGVVNVYFAHNSNEPLGLEDIQFVEMLMRQSPNIKVEISGHTDNVGSAEYNQILSLRRAEAVKAVLVESGIDENRIVAAGYGEDQPISENDTRRGRKLNRRTEFKILEN